MARKASSSSAHTSAQKEKANVARNTQSHSFFARIQRWIHDHPEETRVAAIGAAIAFVFTQGLPLFDSDYTTWLAQADQGWGNLLLRVISPVTSDPQHWGYGDHPLQALLYRVFFTVFGTAGTAWFLVKSLVFGALCGGIWHWMKRMHLDRWAMGASLFLFVMSSSVVGSLVWHADWSVYSQLLLTVVLFWSLREIERIPASRTVYRKGWAALPTNFRNFVLIFFACVYFGSKLGGDLRLAPVVLTTWLWFFRREKFHAYWVPMGISFAATLPWSGELFRKVPPFVSQFSLARIWATLGSDVFNLSIHHSPASWMAAIGVVMLVTLGGYLGYRAYHEKLDSPDEHWGFHLLWLGFALLGCSLMPAQPGDATAAPWLFMALVPTTVLLGMALHSAIHEFSGFPRMRQVVAAIAVAQVAIHGFHSYETRSDLGHRMLAVARAYEDVEKDFANSTFVYGPGFQAYGYKKAALPAFVNARGLGAYDEARTLPAGQTIVASWEPVLDPHFTVERQVSGCGGTVFDAIVSCDQNRGVFLLRYIGDVPEVAQAYQLEGQGNLAAARQVLEGYWTKDHGNFGVSFLIGLDSYKLGDFKRMEVAYDQIGPYFSSNVSVIYNWALAKQGVQNYADASRLLERAYAMVPKDYSIGFNLADTYYKSGKKSRALATLDDLMRVYPNNEPMKKAYDAWQK